MRRDTLVVLLTTIVCLGGWLAFWNLGRLQLTTHDWPKEAYYLDVLRDALLSGRLPFYVPVDLQGTTRFLAIPEWPLSPQILLLPLMGNGAFVMTNCLLLWLLGVLGCLRLRRERWLDTTSFATFLLLFTFNGHIVSHLAVGHSMWAGYFLAPFVLLHTLRFADGDHSARNGLSLAMWLAVMLLQGAFHLATYFGMLLAVAALLATRAAAAGRLGFVAAVAGAVALLAAVRVAPALLAFDGAEDRALISGYPDLAALLNGLATLRQPGFPWTGGFTGLGLGWWEYDAYVGPAGLAAVLFFAIRHLRFGDDPGLRPVSGAGLVLLMLSFGEFTYLFSLIGVPVLGEERVPSRLMVAPLLCFLLAAARGYTGFAAARRPASPAPSLGVLLIAGGLAAHLLLWRVAALETQPYSVWELRPKAIVPDAGYEQLWFASLGLTLAAWIGAMALLWRTRGTAARGGRCLRVNGPD